MKRNMGTIDRVLRILVAAVVAFLYFNGYINGILATVLGVVAVIFALTSFIGTCPLYALFGISTCRT